MKYKKISEELRIQLIDNLHAREHFPAVFDFEPYFSDPLCASADVLPFVCKFGNGTYGVTAMDIWYPRSIQNPEHCRKIRDARKSTKEASSVGDICSSDALYQLGDTELMLILRDSENVEFFPTIRSAMDYALNRLPMPFSVYFRSPVKMCDIEIHDSGSDHKRLIQKLSQLAEIGEFRHGAYCNSRILAFLSREWALYFNIWDESEGQLFFDEDKAESVLPLVERVFQAAGIRTSPPLI